MKLTRGHFLAYLVGVSSNVWAAFFGDLPERARVWVEAGFMAVPLVIVGTASYPTVRSWAIDRARDFQRTLAWLLMTVMVFTWVIDMRRRGVPAEEVTLSVLVLFFIVALFGYRPAGRPSPIA